MRAESRWIGRVLAVVPLTMVLVVCGLPAHAHPFGDPQTVEISWAENTVRVQWKPGGLDDLTLLALQLGLLPGERSTRYLDGAVFFEESDTVVLAESEEFPDYLADRIGVRSDGVVCSGQVESVDDLAGHGAVVAFVCPGSVESAEVTVRMLTDMHPAYRTMAGAQDGQRYVYTASAATHTWTFGAAANASVDAEDDLGRSAALQLSAVLGAVLVAVVASVWVRRRQPRPE